MRFGADLKNKNKDRNLKFSSTNLSNDDAADKTCYSELHRLSSVRRSQYLTSYGLRCTMCRRSVVGGGGVQFNSETTIRYLLYCTVQDTYNQVGIKGEGAVLPSRPTQTILSNLPLKFLKIELPGPGSQHSKLKSIQPMHVASLHSASDITHQVL